MRTQNRTIKPKVQRTQLQPAELAASACVGKLCVSNRCLGSLHFVGAKSLTPDQSGTVALPNFGLALDSDSP